MGSCGSAGAEITGAAAALVSLGDVGPAQTMNGEQGSELCQVIFFRASVNEHTRPALAKDSLYRIKTRPLGAANHLGCY